VNQDLEPLLAVNGFRRDLYYRLNVARILLLPLKDRKEDIPELFSYFLAEFNNRFEGSVRLPNDELLQCLMSYTWPGNIRELRNMVEAIFIDPPIGSISLRDLPDAFQRLFSTYVSDVPERERMISALYQTNWNKSRAAAKLNWSRMTLYRKLEKYHINDPAECHTKQP
jgi:transcriptional regulator of acetoin/glycerol metabolism